MCLTKTASWLFVCSVTALSTVGRRANYTAVLMNIRSELPDASENKISIEELTAESKQARKTEKKAKKLKKQKKQRTPVITKVYTTRRKRIVKKQKIGKLSGRI